MPLEKEQILDQLENDELDVKKAADEFAKLEDNKQVHSERADVRDLLEAYDFEVLDEKLSNRIQRKLESQNEGTREEARAEIIARAENVREYMEKLDTGDSVKLVDGSYESIFNIDRASGIDQKQAYLDKFLSLPLDKQVDWIRKIDEDITMRTEQLNSLVKFVSGEAREEELKVFKGLRTKEKDTYIGKLQNAQTEFERLVISSDLTTAEKKSARENFDSMGLNGKLVELDRLKNALTKNPKNEEFDALSKKRKKEYKKFHTETDERKEAILAEIRDKIKTEYINKLNSCSALTREDLRMMRPTVKGRFDMQLAEACLDYFDKTAALAENEEREGKNFPKEVLEHFGWDNITSLERRRLREEGLLQEYKEEINHVRFDKEYKKRLTEHTNHGEYGLLTKSALNEYYKWFQKLDVDEKEKIIKKEKGADYLQDTLEARKKQNAQFAKLPEQFKKEFDKQYREAGFEERGALIFMLLTEPKKLDSEYEEQVDELLEQNALAPKSKEKLMKTFEGLNFEEKQKHLDAFKKDMKEHLAEATKFFNLVLEAIPENERKLIENKFTNANLHERKKINKEWIKKLNLTEKEAQEKSESTIEDTSPETLLFLQHAEMAERQGELKDALTFYKSIIKSDDNLDPKTARKVQDKIDQIERDLGNYDEEIEAGHFEMALDNEIDSLLSTDSVLAREQEKLTIVEEMYQIKWRNELMFKRHSDTDELMDATLQGEDQTVRDLNEAMLEHTNEEKGIVKNADGKLEVSEQVEFDISMFSEEETRFQRWRAFTAEMQARPPHLQYETKIKLIDPDTNEDLNADQFKIKRDQCREEFAGGLLMNKLLKKMGIDPRTASPKTLITIQQHLADRDYTKRIPRSKESARKAI